MSHDTLTPLLSQPWCDANGRPLPVRALPGIRPDVAQAVQRFYPMMATTAFQTLLETCSGLSDTAIGHIDFTGCWFAPEPCEVFEPCFTLAIDDAGRRWIAEIGDRALPGPIWCVLSKPAVAIYVSEDLSAFISTLRECTCRGHTLRWLQDIQAQAHIVWAYRHSLGSRPYELRESDNEIRSWLEGLPSNAYVYDLRQPKIAQGWPYGLAGPTGRLYRCGRLPVFAVAGPPAEGSYQKSNARIPPQVSSEVEVNYVVATPVQSRLARGQHSSIALSNMRDSTFRPHHRYVPVDRLGLCA